MRYACLFLCWGFFFSANAQELSLYDLFADHAVLQRDSDHPIWGKARPRARLEIQVAGQTLKTRADRAGNWRTTLPAMPAGGPHTISISSRRESISLNDIYFGDVYLLSGQSNMEWRLRQSDLDASRAAAIADPLIREARVEKAFAETPQDNLPLAYNWTPGTVDQIGDFSGVGSYFAHYVRERENIPIGLLHSSWGGSRIEAWMTPEILGEVMDSGEHQSAFEAIKARAEQTYRNAFNQAPPTEDRGEELGYLDPTADARAWPLMPLPTMWESQGYEGVDGHFYFRKDIVLSAAQVAGAATLYLGAIDDSDKTYINGQEIGAMQASWSTAREYAIPAGLLKAGTNSIIIWVEDTGGGGGFSAGEDDFYLQTATNREMLAGDWHYQIGSMRIDTRPNQTPTVLYNAMIHSLAGWPLTGVLWYQGESNAGPDDAPAYAQQFQDMIQYWRQHFERDDLPFYWVQLANFMEPQSSPDEEGWGLIRESQTAALQLPHTHQAVIYDIGEADDIHPRNKWEVGRRLSLAALQDIYGHEDIHPYSPRVSAARVVEQTVVLQIDHVGTGLVARNNRYGYPGGFVLQDDSGRWHWAQATINGSSIHLRVPGIERAVAVRYAYSNNPTDANVFSKEGLPLTPFHLELED